MLPTIGRGPLAAALHKRRRAVSRDDSLQTVLPSCVCDADAAVLASYSGTETSWRNIVAAPADGSPQTAYDWAFQSGPVFSGTAGTAGAYWDTPSGRSFHLGAHTDFSAKVQVTGQGRAFAGFFAFRFNASLGSGSNYHIAGTSAGTGQVGFRLMVLASTKEIYLGLRGDTLQRSVFSGIFLQDDKDYVAGAAIDMDNGQAVFWVNGQKSTVAFSADPCASATVQPFRLCGAGTSSAAGALPRFYAASLFNAMPGDTGAAQVLALYRLRHGRAYN